MKNFRLFLLLGIGLLIGGQSFSLLAEKNGQVKKEELVKEAIENRKLNIDVDRALPLNGNSVNLTSSYSLQISGDSIISMLPYFGRAYSVPYGGGGGLRFTSTMQDYEVTQNKKGEMAISFRTRSDDDSYMFYINVYNNGNTTIRVTPVNKQGITYYGSLDFESQD